MIEHQTSELNYKKGFNEGYILTKHLPQLSDQLWRIKNETPHALLHCFKSIINKWQFEINKNESYDNQMEPLIDALEIMKKKYKHEYVSIGDEIDSVKSWIEENEPNKNKKKSRQKLQSMNDDLNINGTRSIFDDIDE